MVRVSGTIGVGVGVCSLTTGGLIVAVCAAAVASRAVGFNWGKRSDTVSEIASQPLTLISITRRKLYNKMLFKDFLIIYFFIKLNDFVKADFYEVITPIFYRKWAQLSPLEAVIIPDE
jgi:hypothetical protein